MKSTNKPTKYVNTDDYNAHNDYNTVGYSYGPPKENDLNEWKYAPNFQEQFPSYSVPENWPYSRRSLN